MKKARNIFDHPGFVRLLTRISLRLLLWRGWRYDVTPPAEHKYVLIVAPHTSNWDFMLMIPIALLLKRQVRFMGKHTIFWGPFGYLFRWLGGIAVERSSSHNFVDQMATAIKETDEMVLVIAPEGTRSPVDNWKRGFYHIACQANVPIVSCYLDFGRRQAGVWEPFYPTGNAEADMQTIRRNYDSVMPRYPEKFIPMGKAH